MTQIDLVLWWMRSRLHQARGESGASVVEWVLICALVAVLAAVLSVALIRMVIETANTVRTR